VRFICPRQLRSLDGSYDAYLRKYDAAKELAIWQDYQLPANRERLAPIATWEALGASNSPPSNHTVLTAHIVTRVR